MLFSKPKKAIGLDVGTHSVKAVQMSRSGGRLCVDEVGYALLDRAQVNADPEMAHANAIRDALRTMNTPQSAVVGALPGQTVVIRYPRISGVARDQLESAVEREAGQNIPYDLSEVFLDWALLDESQEGDEKQLRVLLVAAKHEIIDSRIQILETAEIQCAVLGVDSLALADAAEACDFLRVGETVAMINIGLTSASIHFIRDGLSNFIRDVNWGARELIQVIAKERRCDFEEAERILHAYEEEVEQAAEEPAEEEATTKTEEAVFGGDDPFGEVPSSGGSLLDPLDDELDGLSGSGAGMRPAPSGTESRALSEILVSPLNRMVSEIRRSFDFYEHQLYERPVDRIILSGGVAHLPVLASMLQEELGVDTVETADPTASAMFFGDEQSVAPLLEHPSQFMVAIGLAARGMADL